MLAIVAVVSTLVLEAIRMATSSGVRIERVARDAVHSHIDAAAVRSAIAATQTAYHDEPGGFVGTARAFRGVTTNAVISNIGANTLFEVRVSDDGRTTRLVYVEQGRNEWAVLDLERADARLSYWHEDDGRWLPSWPPEATDATYYAPTPAAVKLEWSSDNETGATIWAIQHNTIPVQRVQDIISVQGN